MLINELGSLKYSATVMEHHIKDESNQAMAYREMPAGGSRNGWL